jgi:hypothetical protein
MRLWKQHTQRIITGENAGTVMLVKIPVLLIAHSTSKKGRVQQ